MEPDDDAHTAQGDVGDGPFEALPSGAVCAREVQIRADDPDLVGRPAQCGRARDEIVLALPALDVVAHLGECPLADLRDRLTGEALGADALLAAHDTSLPNAPVSRSTPSCATVLPQLPRGSSRFWAAPSVASSMTESSSRPWSPSSIICSCKLSIFYTYQPLPAPRAGTGSRSTLSK